MVYVIHFETPLSHAQHYIGYCRKGRLRERLNEHRTGKGARILQACNEAGINYWVSDLIPGGTRKLERKMKNYKKGSRFCPVCQNHKANE